MKPPNLSPEDLLALSAYIDDALSPPERAMLEQRLTNDNTLRQELETLRQTVALLNTLQPIKAPRDFRLDPAVYGQQSVAAESKVRQIPLWRRGSIIGIAAVITLFFAVGLLVINLGSAEESGDSLAGSVNEEAMITSVAQNIAPTHTSLPTQEPSPMPTSVNVEATPLANGINESSSGVSGGDSGAAIEPTPTPTSNARRDPTVASMLPTATQMHMAPLRTATPQQTATMTSVDGEIAAAAPEAETDAGVMATNPSPTEMIVFDNAVDDAQTEASNDGGRNVDQDVVESSEAAQPTDPIAADAMPSTGDSPDTTELDEADVDAFSNDGLNEESAPPFADPVIADANEDSLDESTTSTSDITDAQQPNSNGPTETIDERSDVLRTQLTQLAEPLRAFAYRLSETLRRYVLLSN